MRRSYSFRIYKGAELTKPIISGCTTADSMDDAMLQIVRSAKLKVVATLEDTHMPMYHLERDGQKVGLYIYAQLNQLNEMLKEE
jgi:hypothetical protein